ncbi:nucleoside hydrolase [Chloroflexota bacterium]|nr:nucleoside hydrolase [Chloroflexota bacterium]
MRRIVIDCDPGIDDAQAIMMAHSHPDINIEAITTVSGNVGVEHTAANALKILDILDAEPIPVYAGAASGLVTEGQNASYVHGEDGLGGVDIPESKRKLEDKPAALALIDLAKENPGELELIAIGPLTNLALALRLDPKLPSRYKKLVIMGGAHFAQGNTPNYSAEFNLYADPDAAAVVFANWPKFTMISWEATISHGMPIEDFTALFEFDNKRSKFLRDITQHTIKFLREVLNREMSFAADPLAMAVLMEPEIVEEVAERYVQVERTGELSRGMTVIDWWGMSKKPANVEIILKVNQDRFYQLMKNAFE